MLLVFCVLMVCGWQQALAQTKVQDTHLFAQSKQWLYALHYQKSGPGFKSNIDNPHFFLAKGGKNNPYKELKASIDFLTYKPKTAEQGKCLLPFRYRTLREAGLIEADPRPCPKVDFFKKELGTDGASMVFVGQYADNPASIMGHTIIAFHNNSRYLEGSPLIFLDYAMNFAAAVPPNTNIVKYIIYGIFGGFQGRYSLLEFGDVFEKYNNMEGRDIFYYRLHFSSLDCEKLLEHVWELLSRASHDYFFFDDNCAYQLLAVLQAIRIDKDLLSDLPAYVSPIEIVKTLVNQDLVSKVDYEPSIFQRIVNSLKSLDKSDHIGYFDILNYRKGVQTINSPLLAEALIDTLTFAKHEAQGNLSPKQASLQSKLLLRRSKLGIYKKEASPPKPPPHLSHPDKRISIGQGLSQDGSFLQLVFRPAVHDRLSRPEGYQRHSSLSFLQPDIRLYPEKKQFVVKEIKILEGSKLKGYPVLPRFSWHSELGFINDKPQCPSCLIPRAVFDLGKSKSFFLEKLDSYLMLRAHYRDMVQEEGYGASLGVAGGIFLTPHPKFRAYLSIARTRNLRGQVLDSFKSSWNIDGPHESDIRLTAQLEAYQKKLIKREVSLAAGYSF